MPTSKGKKAAKGWSKIYDINTNILLIAGAVVVFAFIAWAFHNVSGLSAGAMVLGNQQRNIEPPFLALNSVSSPPAGASWEMGKTYTINWKLSQKRNPNTNAQAVSITLGQLPPACLSAVPPCKIMQPASYKIVSGIKNSGSYSWTIPANLSANYQGKQIITVALDTDPSVNISSHEFSIISVGPQFTITSPAANDAWRQGFKYTIKWSPASACLDPSSACAPPADEGSVPPSVVSIFLQDPAGSFGSSATTIATNVKNTGSYIWMVPKNLAQNGQPKSIYIKGVASGAQGWTGVSAKFTINGSIVRKRICPTAWYNNQMPGSGTSSQYLIVGGQRAEITGYDLDWIRLKCKVNHATVVQ